MKKRNLILFIVLTLVSGTAFAQNTVPDRFINKTLSQNIYPPTINNTRQKPETSSGIGSVKINPTGNMTSNQSVGKRKVIKRQTRARAATMQTTQNNRRVVQRPGTVARAANNNNNMYRMNNAQQNNPRRQAVKRNTAVKARASTTKNSSTASTKTYTSSSSKACFADYKACMENYCKREDTAYNRCFCSAKLAQIDAKYQPKIDSLMQQIVRLKYNTNTSEAEIEEYLEETLGGLTTSNSWTNIDNALNINWADTEDRIRGQNAFNIGHDFCVQNLQSCFSMASNMRDAYKSEIARDCAAYEQSLQKIQSAAESVIENYHD